MHTAEPLVFCPSSFDVETATGKLKKCESQGIDQIAAEVIQAGGNTNNMF
jgi:hypothetical protein